MSETIVSWPAAESRRRACDDDTLTPARVRTVLAITLLFAAVRLGSIASGPWDWDEALFSLAVAGDFDIAAHHPHPPGFPAYIAMAKLIAPLTGAFHSLQAIVVAAAVVLFPLMFAVAREMGFEYRTSVTAAGLLASFPNIVVFGGSAFSDVPALAFTLGAVLLTLRGRTLPRAIPVAAVLSGIAMGFRVQSALALVAPGLIVLRRGRPVEVARAALVGLVVVASIYGGAVLATGSLDRYVSAVRHHGEFIRSVDSFASPSRAPLGEIFDRVLRPWTAGELGGAVLFFAGIALVDLVAKRHKPTLLAIATFGPFFVFAWLMLDVHSMSRLSIGYMPLHALLAAHGIVIVAAMVSGWLGIRKSACSILLGCALCLSLLGWARDPVAAIRADEPPPVAAMTWIRHNLSPGDTTVWVESATLGPFADLELEGWDVRRFEKWADIEGTGDGRRSWIVVEGRHDDAAATFSRAERHLRQVVRDRFFDTSVIPLDETVLFGEGWYGREGTGDSWWRWMSGDATIVIPPSTRARVLRLELEYPTDTANHVSVAITLDGRAIDVPARPVGGRTEAVIELPPLRSKRTISIRVTPTVRPVDVGTSGDDRALGARLVACDVGAG